MPKISIANAELGVSVPIPTPPSTINPFVGAEDVLYPLPIMRFPKTLVVFPGILILPLITRFSKTPEKLVKLFSTMTFSEILVDPETSKTKLFCAFAKFGEKTLKIFPSPN